MKYLNIDEIKQAFAEHLMKHRGYTAEEADMAVFDFPDPYSNCYLDESYIGSCEIDGVTYKKYATSTDLWRVGIHNTPNFFFYTYYREEDSDYKLYQIDDLYEDDFPLLKYEKENMK
jgi:hypothetical protein